VALMASSPDKQILALIHLPLQIQAGDLPWDPNSTMGQEMLFIFS
jgi:hypothetical protein